MSGKNLTALVLALAACMNVSAQTDSAASGFSVMGIVSLPQGDFGDDKGRGAGNATMGFGAGVEYLMPMKESKNLHFVAGGYYIHNPMDLSDQEDDDISIDAEGWKNFGVLGGVRMTDVGGVEGFYLQGMLGFNMATVGDIEITAESYDYYYDEYYDMTVTQTTSSESSLAFSLGAGKKFGKWDIGVRYLNFGEPEFKVEIEDEDGDEIGSGKIKQKISMLAFTVGYSF
jgi:hypothetical protein